MQNNTERIPQHTRVRQVYFAIRPGFFLMLQLSPKFNYLCCQRLGTSPWRTLDSQVKYLVPENLFQGLCVKEWRKPWLHCIGNGPLHLARQTRSGPGIPINHLPHIGPEEPVLFRKPLVILLKSPKMVLNALLILGILRLARAINGRRVGHGLFFLKQDEDMPNSLCGKLNCK